MRGLGGRRRAGFTLIELLLVIVILAVIAGSAVAMLETATGDAQVRFDDTRNRLERLRTAILGAEGATTPQGFVADVGRLPDTLLELVQCPPALAGASPPIWRGPYLRTLPGASGGLELPDGWGRDTGAPLDFGWRVHRYLLPVDDPSTIAPIESGDLHIQSLGLDGAVTPVPVPPAVGDVYAADFPPTPDPTASPQRLPFVRCADYLVRIAGVELTCVLPAPDGSAFTGGCRLTFAGSGLVALGDFTGATAGNEVRFRFHDLPSEPAVAPIGRHLLRVQSGTTTYEGTIDVLPRAPLTTVRLRSAP